MAWKGSIWIPPVRNLGTSSHVLYHQVMQGLRLCYLFLKQKHSEANTWYQVFVVRRSLERWFPSSCIWTKYFLHGMLTCDIWPLGSDLWILYWLISWKLSIGLHYSVTSNGNVMCCAVERLIYYLHKIVWRIGKYQCFWLQKQIKDVTTSEYAAENSYKGFFLFPFSSVNSKM